MVRAAFADDRAQEVKAAIDRKWVGNPLSYQKDGITVVIDARPELIHGKGNAVIGTDALLRVFVGAEELRVDPHRIVINPPTVPRSGITEKVIGADKYGRPLFETTYSPDPEAAFIEALFNTVSNMPNPRGWRTRGTVTTIYETNVSAQGCIGSDSATYSTMRAGNNLVVLTEAQSYAGQALDGVYFALSVYWSFDTSSIPDTDVISDAALSAVWHTDFSTTDFVLQARFKLYGTLTTADWVAGDDWGSLPLLGTQDSSAYSDENYFTFTNSGTNLIDNIDKTGVTEIVVNSDRFGAGTTPTNNEYVQLRGASEAGTTADPVLEVTHAAAANTRRYSLPLSGVG